MKRFQFSLAWTVAALLPIIGTGCYENFGDAERVTTYSGVFYDSDITADSSDNLHIVARSDASFRHYKSTNAGDSWVGQAVDTGDGAIYPTRNECAVTYNESNDQLQAVYTEDNDDGGGRVNFRSSDDEGESWNGSKVLRSGDGPKSDLHIASRPSSSTKAIVAAWREVSEADNAWETRTRTSLDGGETWESSVQASWGRNCRPLGLAYTASGTRVVLLYALSSTTDRYRTHVRAKYSTDNGLTWSSYIGIAEYGRSYDIHSGDLSLNNSDMVAVWATNYHLSTSISTDNGSTWGSEESVASGWNDRNDVRLLVGGGLPAVLSYTSTEDIYYREDEGDGWVGSRRLNNYIDLVHEYGGMVATADGMHAVWLDDRWDGAGDPELTWANAEMTPTDQEFSCFFSQGTTFPFVIRRETRSFDIKVSNWTGETSAVQVWLEADGDNGLNKFLKVWTLELDSEEEEILSYTVTVPSSTPIQDYTITAYCGIWRSDYVVDKDAFRVTVEQ